MPSRKTNVAIAIIVLIKSIVLGIGIEVGLMDENMIVRVGDNNMKNYLNSALLCLTKYGKVILLSRGGNTTKMIYIAAILKDEYQVVNLEKIEFDFNQITMKDGGKVLEAKLVLISNGGMVVACIGK